MPTINCPNDVYYRPIILNGHQTKYIVSTEGNVYNSVTMHQLHPAVTNRGYRRLLIYYNGYRRHMSVHRLVADAFLPNPLQLPEVNHKNGDKSDNSVYNLEWCTAEYNVKHSFDTGLNHSGEENHNAGMSNETARRIAQCFEDNQLTMTEISRYFDIPKRSIKHMLYGDCWKRVVDNYDFSKYTIMDCKYNHILQNPRMVLTPDQSELFRALELLSTTSYTEKDVSKILDIPVRKIQEFKKENKWDLSRLRTGTMIVHRVNTTLPLNCNKRRRK